MSNYTPTQTTPHPTSFPFHARLIVFLKARFSLLFKGVTAEEEVVKGLLTPPPSLLSATQTTKLVGTPTVHVRSTHWYVVLFSLLHSIKANATLMTRFVFALAAIAVIVVLFMIKWRLGRTRASLESARSIALSEEEVQALEKVHEECCVGNISEEKERERGRPATSAQTQVYYIVTLRYILRL